MMHLIDKVTEVMVVYRNDVMMTLKEAEYCMSIRISNSRAVSNHIRQHRQEVPFQCDLVDANKVPISVGTVDMLEPLLFKKNV